ncbi:MAG: peptidylprolyl isomerase [Ruminiclostridium sp.]|nr:peptidylprolyl isomerase [Ruminiclostridium sp.]
MKSILKKAAAGILTAALISAASGCALFGGGNEGLNENPLRTFDYSSMKLVQLEEPREGQKTAVIETDAGTITAVLYPEYAPNTVQNFINRANEGYYNGKDIYCVLEKSIFMSGAFDESRNSGATEDGQPIANEYTADLWPFKGAVCSFSGRVGYGDSRFMVMNSRELSEEDFDQLREFRNNNDQALPEELLTAFREKGVVIDFAGAYTVFAQTIEGFDVIEKICSANVSGDLSIPDPPIYIKSVTIGEYHAQEQ